MKNTTDAISLLLFSAYPFPATEAEPLFCGGQYHPYFFSRALNRAGAKVFLVCRAEHGQPKTQQVNGVTVCRYLPVAHVGGHKRGISFSLNRLKRVRQLIRTQNIDWAISFSPLLWELFLLKRYQIPFCYMIPGLNMGFLQNLNNTPLQLLRKLAIKYISRPLLKLNLRHSRLIFANCSSDLALTKLFYRPNAPLFISKNGVDIHNYRPIDNVAPSRVFLVLGRFSPEKGFHDVIEASKKIKNGFPDMTLHFVGFVDNKTYLGRLKAMIKADRLSSWVQIETNVPESRIPDIFSNALACIVFSNGYDPLPSVIFQAMSCGIPVISTDWSPRREIIEHGKNGLLVPEGDTDLLAQQMHYLLSNPVMADQMGKTAREIVISHRDFNMIARDFLSQLRCAA